MNLCRIPVGLLAAAFTAAAVVGPVMPALAFSKAADYLIGQQIAEGCEGANGQIDPAYVFERDLTGDGKPDLIISHEGIGCASGGRSIYCGAQACSFYVYVRKGKLLELAEEGLGAEVAVGPGDAPPIFWFSNDGSAQAMRWFNGKFE